MGIDCKVIAKMKDGTKAYIDQDRLYAWHNEETLDIEMENTQTSVSEALSITDTLLNQKDKSERHKIHLKHCAKMLMKHRHNIEHVFVQSDQVGIDEEYYTVKTELV